MPRRPSIWPRTAPPPPGATDTIGTVIDTALANKLEAANELTWLLDPDGDTIPFAHYDSGDEAAARDWLASITSADDSVPDLASVWAEISEQIADEGDPILLIGVDPIGVDLFDTPL